MNDLTKVDNATSLVLGATPGWEVACARHTAPPVPAYQGTGLPVGGPSLMTIDGTGMPFAGADLVADGVGNPIRIKGTPVRVPAADAAQGTSPPRRTPSRC